MIISITPILISIAIFATPAPLSSREMSEQLPANKQLAMNSKKTSNIDGQKKTHLPSQKHFQEALGLAAEALKREKREIQEERRRLEVLKKEIKTEIDRLSALLKPLAQSRDEVRNKRIRHMVKGLSAMSPSSAAVALTGMDDALVVELLAIMNGKLVGKVLESMESKKAARLIQAVINKKPAARGRED